MAEPLLRRTFSRLRGRDRPKKLEVKDRGDDAANGPGDFGGGGRSPPHGSYLQSLERSSRRWVLGHEEPGGDTDGGATTSGDIWYNPIPEDDDPRGGHGKESPSQKSWEEPPRSAMGTLGTGDVGGTREEPGAGRTQAFGPVSGLVAVHLRGVRDLKPAAPSAEPRDYFCVLQVDSAKRARTALVPAQGAALGLNHNFNLELEAARHLKVMVFAWDAAARRNRLCGHGTVGLPHVFQDHRTQQLAVRLQPRGILYTKLTLVRQNPQPGAPQPPFGAETPSFGSEPPSFGSEPRVVVGLYRLCGSAAVKKELRDAFERDSAAVTLSERRYPDINVVTGVLKDFLRELPSPLIPPGLYRAVLGTMGTSGTLGTTGSHREATTLLDGLPEPEKATLTCLLDHLSLVASFRDCNRMTPQNLAVCFGPVLLARPPVPDVTDVTDVTAARPRCPRGPQGDVPVDFKCHLEVLHYLLRAWPVDLPPVTPVTPSVPPLVTPRPRPRGPESPPSNRYAGDWSVCDPPGPQGTAGDTGDTTMGTRFGDIGDSPRLSLRDFDALIRELERELAQPIDVCL
ncbi:hypothetical protein A306_00014645 [Columba livia]|uniref:Uncharacterized protein n=1 Tax=Columba livia TaxID=8932 RepID=A0A2I0LIK7_COLLI|nr:hypothetical protein A306_00014645 [Columba livia]